MASWIGKRKRPFSFHHITYFNKGFARWWSVPVALAARQSGMESARLPRPRLNASVVATCLQTSHAVNCAATNEIHFLQAHLRSQESLCSHSFVSEAFAGVVLRTISSQIWSGVNEFVGDSTLGLNIQNCLKVLLKSAESPGVSPWLRFLIISHRNRATH